MNELDIPVGTKEKQRLMPGSVLVTKVTIDPKKTRKNGEAKLVTFHCKHPDREQLIALSNVKIKKIQGNNETITKDTLWYHLDEDGNLSKDSNVARVLTFYKKKSLGEFVHSSIDTELDAAGYLAIKAY